MNTADARDSIMPRLEFWPWCHHGLKDLSFQTHTAIPTYLKLRENLFDVSEATFSNVEVFVKRTPFEQRLRCILEELSEREQLGNLLNTHTLLIKNHFLKVNNGLCCKFSTSIAWKFMNLQLRFRFTQMICYLCANNDFNFKRWRLIKK